MDSELALTIISTSAFSALMTLALTRSLEWRRRRKQARGYLAGIQLEIAYAEECADEYTATIEKGAPVWAPNYRTITEFTKLHLPSLAAEGIVTAAEANQLFRFLTRATEINRSLDMLQSLTSASGYKPPAEPTGTTREELETKRANLKCKNMLGKAADQRVGSAPEAWHATTNALARLNRFSAFRFTPQPVQQHARNERV